MPVRDGWSKRVIGSPTKHHDSNRAAGEYGFYRLERKMEGVTVVADVYPDFGADRWMWGVRFPAQKQLTRWHPERKEEVVTRAAKREWRTGGHSASLEEAQKAAEQAIRAGRESTT